MHEINFYFFFEQIKPETYISTDSKHKNRSFKLVLLLKNLTFLPRKA